MLSGPVAVLGFTCLKYSWCSVIWASGCIRIHMLKRASNLVLVCIEPLKVILRSRRSIQISWICLCFCEKSWQSKRLKNWFSSLTSPALFTKAIFCVLPFTYLLINFIPLHTLLILLYVKLLLFKYFLYCSFCLRISSFSSFCTDLYSSLSFFWNASFFLLMMPLILLVIQGLLLGFCFTYFWLKRQS